MADPIRAELEALAAAGVLQRLDALEERVDTILRGTGTVTKTRTDARKDKTSGKSE